MNDWVDLLSKIVQLLTAVMLLEGGRRKKAKKKGTKRRVGRKR